MMVKYDQTKHKKQFQSRPKTSEYEPRKDYDPHRVLDNINNFKKTVSPNFDLMTSRPTDGDPLPSYMKVNYYFKYILRIYILVKLLKC